MFNSEKKLGIYLPLGDAYLSLNNFASKYFGLNFKEYKILDFNNVFSLDNVTIKENEVKIDGITLSFNGNKLSIDKFIPLLIDLRHLYDYNPFNRKIDIKYLNDEITIDSNNTPLKLKLKGDLKKIDKNELEKLKIKKIIDNFSFDGKHYWIERVYEFDRRRGEKKEFYNWYVLFLGYFKGVIEFNFSFKDKKEEFYSLSKEFLTKINKISNTYIRLAFKILARNLMDKKVGRPWFFQEWKRDKLISLRAFYILGEKKFVRNLLLNYFTKALEVNKKNKLFLEFKTDEFGLLLNKIVEFWDLFDEKQKEIIKEKISSFDFNAPIYNRKGDTWMDSINREGISIEIQALFHKFFSFFEKEFKEFSYLKKIIEKTVKDMIINDFIIDGLERYEIRPNFLLAWYFNEELAEKLSFNKYLNNNLDQLFLNWGGITSLSKCHPLHYKEHTGIDSKSYHNGDSWYFINNITALILLKQNEIEKAYKIINASLNDLFLDFFTGAHSEISSAKKQEGFGCFDQLWSNATLLETLNFLLFEKNK
jgi:hypothetical protein